MWEGLSRREIVEVSDHRIFSTHRHLRTRIAAGLEGRGALWLEDAPTPKVGVLYHDLLFPGGSAAHPLAPRIVSDIPPYLMVVPPDPEWMELLKKIWGKKFASKSRWSMRPLDPLSLDTPRRTGGGERFSIHPIDQASVGEIRGLDAGLLAPWDEFSGRGLYCFGYFARQGSQVVGAATVVAQAGPSVEIAVSTDRRMRGRGIGFCVCMALIDECRRRRLEPVWDAENPQSRDLALRLGFTDPERYGACFRRV